MQYLKPDNNYQGVGEHSPLPVNTSIGGRIVEKEVAFDGTAGNGAQGTVALFTVTGTILLKLYAICSESLAGASATIAVGTANNATDLIAQATATDIDEHDIWHDNSPDKDIESSSVVSQKIVSNGNNLIATIGTADITDGTIKFIAEWTPLSSDGNLTAA